MADVCTIAPASKELLPLALPLLLGLIIAFWVGFQAIFKAFKAPPVFCPICFSFLSAPLAAYYLNLAPLVPILAAFSIGWTETSLKFISLYISWRRVQDEAKGIMFGSEAQTIVKAIGLFLSLLLYGLLLRLVGVW